MKKFLEDLIANGVPIACVGGSDFVKLKEQLGEDCIYLRFYNIVLMSSDFSFSENGVLAYKKGKLIESSV